MLFAESSQMEVWIGPVLTSVAGLAATIITWLTARDKMRFDAERVKMLADIIHLKADNQHCHENHKALTAVYKSLHEEFNQLRDDVARRGFKSDPPERIKEAVMAARAEAKRAEAEAKKDAAPPQ